MSLLKERSELRKWIREYHRFKARSGKDPYREHIARAKARLWNVERELLFRAVPYLLFAGIMTLIFIVFIFSPSFTGFVVHDLEFANGTAYILELGDEPVFLDIEASALWDGNAVVYIEQNGARYKALDTSNFSGCLDACRIPFKGNVTILSEGSSLLKLLIKSRPAPSEVSQFEPEASDVSPKGEVMQGNRTPATIEPVMDGADESHSDGMEENVDAGESDVLDEENVSANLSYEPETEDTVTDNMAFEDVLINRTLDNITDQLDGIIGDETSKELSELIPEPAEPVHETAQVPELPKTINLPPEGSVPDQVMEENMLLTIDLSQYFKDNENDPRSYSFDETHSLGLYIKGSVLEITTRNRTGIVPVVLFIEDNESIVSSIFRVEVLASTDDKAVNQSAMISELQAKLGVRIEKLESILGKLDIRLEKEGAVLDLKGALDVREVRVSEEKDAELRGKRYPLGTSIIAVEAEVERASIVLEKTGPVNAILKCSDYDFDADSCGSWERTSISFADNGTHISFEVESFSAYTGAYLTIIDLQSYPTVGGNWTVRFNTTGVANLTISASNGTTYGDDLPYDLKWLQIRCDDYALPEGSGTMQYQFNGSHLFVLDWNCSGIGYHTVSPLTPGEHTQEFVFGDEVGYAKNWAKSGNVYNCTSCADCTNAIANASAGDIVRLTANLTNQAGDCIIFYGRDDIIFDCLGNQVGGNNANTSVGVFLDSGGGGSANVTIRNCKITNWWAGIYADPAQNITLKDSNLSNNTFLAMYAYDGRSFNISNISLTNNKGYGFYLNLNHSTFNNIRAYRSDWSITFGANSTNCSLSDLVLTDGYRGLFISKSSNFSIKGVTVRNNTYSLYAENISRSIIRDVTCINNTNGPRLSFARDTLVYNLTTSQSERGLLIDINSRNVTAISFNLSNNSITGVGIENSQYINLSGLILTDNYDEGLTFFNLYDSSISDVNISTRYDISSDGALYLEDSLRNRFNNITVKGGNYGIYSYNSRFNSYSSINLTGSAAVNFFVELSNFTNLTDIWISNDGDTGLVVVNSHGSRIRGLYFHNNTDDAVQVLLSNFTDWRDVYLLRTNDKGNDGAFHVVLSDNSNFTNITVNSCNTTGFLLWGSRNNTILNSTFRNCTIAGMRIVNYTSIYSSGNIISNSIFNNTRNLDIAQSGSYINSLNTSLTSGTNIVGGNYIGGNYWANTTGTGFSQTCTDVSAPYGICDNYYNLSNGTSIAVDYLPLAKTNALSACQNLSSPGVYMLSNNVTASGTCFNVTSDNVTLLCSGNAMIGKLAGSGISIVGRKSFVASDCIITNFTRAVNLSNANISVLNNITILNNSGEHSGIYAWQSHYNNITNSRWLDNNASYSAGVYLDRSHFNRLHNLTLVNSRVRRNGNLMAGGVIGLNISNSTDTYNVNISMVNVTTSGGIYDIYGGIVGLYYSNGNMFSRISINSSRLNASFIYGGALGIAYSRLNTFVSVNITNTTVTSSNDIYGGIFGMFDTTNNTLSGITLINTNVTAGDELYGGGFGLSYAVNNTIRSVSITNTYARANSDVLGSGGFGLDYAVGNNVSEVNVTETKSFSYGIYGGGGFGYRLSHNNTVSGVIITNTSVNVTQMSGGGGFGLAWSSSNNTIRDVTVSRTMLNASNNLDGGGCFGFHWYTNKNLVNNITVVDTRVFIGNEIYGGGCFGLNEGGINNIISNVSITNTNVSAVNAIAASGGFGLRNVQSNIISGVTVTDTSIATPNLYGGGGFGLDGLTSNNIISGVTVINTSLIASTDLFGGGGFGLSNVVNNTISNVSIINTYAKANNRILGSGGFGLDSTTGNNISLVNVTNTTATTGEIYGGGGFGYRLAHNNTVSGVIITNTSVNVTNMYGGGGFGLAWDSSNNTISGVTIMKTLVNASNNLNGGGGFGFYWYNLNNRVNNVTAVDTRVFVGNELYGSGGFGLSNAFNNTIRSVSITNTYAKANSDVLGSGGFGLDYAVGNNVSEVNVTETKSFSYRIYGGGGFGYRLAHNNTVSGVIITNTSVNVTNMVGGGGFGLAWDSSNNTISGVTIMKTLVNASNNLYGGGGFGFYWYNLNNRVNNVTAVDTRVAVGSELYGGGGFGLTEGGSNNIISNVSITNTNLSAVTAVYASGGFGLRNVQSNIISGVTVTDTSIATPNLYGGGGFGLYWLASNNIISGVTVINTSLSASTDLFGGGGFGLYDTVTNNSISGVRLTNTNVTLGNIIFGSGGFGLSNVVNNTISTVSITNTYAKASNEIFGSGGLGLDSATGNNVSLVNVTNTTATTGEIYGGGGLGYRLAHNNTVSGVIITNTSVNVTNMVGGGGFGLAWDSSNNTISGVTIMRTLVNASNNLYGGGGFGFYWYNLNNRVNNVTAVDTRVAVGSELYGGGGFGLTEGGSNNIISNVSITDTNVSAVAAVYGSGGLGLWLVTNNMLSWVNIGNSTVNTPTITGGGVLGLSNGASLNTLDNIAIKNATINVSSTIFGSSGVGIWYSSNNNLSDISLEKIDASSSTLYGGVGIGIYEISHRNILRRISLYEVTINNIISPLVGLQRNVTGNIISDSIFNFSNASILQLYNETINGVGNNTFQNLQLINASKHAILADTGFVINNTFRNITITGTGMSAINLTNARDIDLINITFADTPWDVYAYNASIRNYSMQNFSLKWENGSGSITFINQTLNATGSNLSQVIKLANNSAFINTTLDARFNTTANITLYNLGFILPKVQVSYLDDGNFQDCIAPQCNWLSYSGGAFTFNVSRFTTYQAAENSNTRPLINQTNITPIPIYRNSSINCSAYAYDNQSANFNISFTWFVNSTLNGSWNTTVQCTNGTWCYTNVSPTGLLKHYNITCSARAFDGSLHSDWKNSTTVEINNSPPYNVTLFYPLDNSSIINRTPFFNWTAFDIDNDSLWYNLIVDDSPYFDYPEINITINATNYTPSFELLFKPYYWYVRAYDNESWSPNSSKYNFTVLSYVSILLTNSSINFGSMQLNETNDTSDNLPGPFVIENDGNCDINVSLNSTQLWLMQPLGTSYFQVKVDNTTELGSFNWALSQTSWTPVANMTSLLRGFNHNSTKDTAEIDILVRVPLDEPPGSRFANITLWGGEN